MHRRQNQSAIAKASCSEDALCAPSLVAPVVNFRYSSAAVTRRSLAVAAPAPSARLHSSGWKYFRPQGLLLVTPSQDCSSSSRPRADPLAALGIIEWAWRHVWWLPVRVRRCLVFLL